MRSLNITFFQCNANFGRAYCYMIEHMFRNFIYLILKFILVRFK